MIESQERTVDVQNVNTPPTAAVSETATPSLAPVVASAAAVGNREIQKQVSPAHQTDRRSVQRHANVMKARAGHRRNIRRSNTSLRGPSRWYWTAGCCVCARRVPSLHWRVSAQNACQFGAQGTPVSESPDSQPQPRKQPRGPKMASQSR